jgi:rod shape-determining protein MreD
MSRTWLSLTLSGLLVVLIQVVFLNHLTIFRAPADLVFVFLLGVMLSENRTISLLLTGLLSFLQDAFSDTWGIHLIGNVLFVYLFHAILHRLKDAALSIPQQFLLTLGSVFVNLLIVLNIARFSDQSGAGFYFWQLLIAGSLYTAITGTIYQLLRGR